MEDSFELDLTWILWILSMKKIHDIFSKKEFNIKGEKKKEQQELPNFFFFGVGWTPLTNNSKGFSCLILKILPV